MAPFDRPTQSATAAAECRLPTGAALADWGFLLVAVAIVVGQTLIPSESPPEQGTQLPWQMLTLLAGGTWFLMGLKRDDLPVNFQLSDALLLATIGCIALSGWYAAEQGAPRAAINATWQWIHVALLYFLLRQWIRTAAAARVVVVAMLGLATAEAVIGLYQYTIAFPAMREQFAENPEAVLKAAGQWVPPDSPQRRLLEDRIMSREPLGTFALANSLAGLLVPWILIGLGLSVENLSLVSLQASRARSGSDGAPSHASGPPTTTGSDPPPPDSVATSFAKMSTTLSVRRTLLAVATVLGPTIVVLLLTKSRAAYLAVAAGALLLAGRFSAATLARWPRRVLVVGAVVCAVVVTSLALSGGLDRQVLTEAPKSLAYRLEYWQATWRMIADHPWCGVGPGQFQDRYTQYKLATASEEIADPHNFLLELAATGGLPAAGCFLAFLGSVFWPLIRRAGRHGSPLALIKTASAAGQAASDGPLRVRTARSQASPPRGRSSQSSRSMFAWLSRVPSGDRVACGGPLLGIGAAVLASLAFPFLGIVPLSLAVATTTAATACFVVVLWRPWQRVGPIRPEIIAVAVAAMLLHLSASGGISYAGVAATFWTLVAIAPALRCQPASGFSRVPNGQPAGPAPGPEARFASVWLRWLLTGAWALIAVVWYTTAYRPVVSSQGYLWAAQHSSNTPNEVDRNLRAAVEADPYNAAAWDALLQHLLVQWMRSDASPSDRKMLRRRIEEALHQLLSCRPQSSVVWARAADIYLAIYEPTHDPAALEQAIDALQRATLLYPTSALLHGRLALLLAETGRLSAAREEARQAIRLDRITPHADKKLPSDLQTALEHLLAAP